MCHYVCELTKIKRIHFIIMQANPNYNIVSGGLITIIQPIEMYVPIYFIVPTIPTIPTTPTALPIDIVRYTNTWQSANEYILSKPKRGHCGYVYRLSLTTLSDAEWQFFQQENNVQSAVFPRYNDNNDVDVETDLNWERIIFKCHDRQEVPIYNGQPFDLVRDYTRRERQTGQGNLEFYRAKILSISIWRHKVFHVVECCFSYKDQKKMSNGEWVDV